jgi:hypothetical protein
MMGVHMGSFAAEMPETTAASTGMLGQANDVEAVAECDVIMKGGITSGVIYPLAICELATRYQLHNVGGTSAGAIAAAAAAAAERGRRRHLADPTSPAGGYGQLAKLPEQLGTELLSLFRPAPSTRSLFKIMLAASKAPSQPIAKEQREVERGKRLGPKVWPTIRAVVGQQLGWFLLGLLGLVALALLALWLAGPASGGLTLVVVLLAVLLGAVVGLALVGWSLYRVLVNNVRDNCSLLGWLICLMSSPGTGTGRSPSLTCGARRPPTSIGPPRRPKKGSASPSRCACAASARSTWR